MRAGADFRDLNNSQNVNVESKRKIRRIVDGGKKLAMEKSEKFQIGAGDMLLFEL